MYTAKNQVSFPSYPQPLLGSWNTQ